MLERIPLPSKPLRAYRKFLTRDVRERLHRCARLLHGKRVLHINSTPRGGGVAALLHSVIPLECSAGIDSQWYAMAAPREFFVVTKAIHNMLQGKRGTISASQKKLYFDINRQLARELDTLKADLFILHDPQPLGAILDFHKRPMVSRMHIDLSVPNQSVFSWIRPILVQYDNVVLSLKAFIPRGMARNKITLSAPAIDPLDEKFAPMTQQRAKHFLKGFGIDPKRPFIAQVSRYDLWKGPLDVVRAYKLVKKKIPGLQLVMLGFFLERDDPESRAVFAKVKKAVGNDPDVTLFSDPSILDGTSNSTMVNAVQHGADVVLQNSHREGFGLTVTEAMWKKKAVIGGPAAGIRAQIVYGKNGYIANSKLQLANQIVALITNPRLRGRFGKAAHESVRKNYLIPRLLADHLELYEKMLMMGE